MATFRISSVYGSDDDFRLNAYKYEATDAGDAF